MDIGRIADLPAVNQTNLTRSSEQRTETKSSTLASEHTDSFIKSEAAFTPAYTKRSAQKQSSDNNLLQRENSESTVDKINENGGKPRSELMTEGVQHIIRAMFVKQGEVLSGNVPSIGAQLYAEQLLTQIRGLYGNSADDENSAEYWQPAPTAERLKTFFECVVVDGDKEEVISRAFNAAFKSTEELFGGRGRLPLESYETRELIVNGYMKQLQ
ncbi:MAG: hypothetical protein K2O14_04540 [Oscillospiraceae bacterium]|nr:hypothetical protein [Oscillospiraceae bacterium]